MTSPAHKTGRPKTGDRRRSGKAARGLALPPAGPDSLQPQDLVLDLLGWYPRPAGGRAWSGGLVLLLGDLGFTRGAARIALGRLVRRDLLARIRESRLVYYVPTPRLERVLAEGERRIRSFGHELSWDGLWTVLWYAVPVDQKTERRRLARRLRFLGFGSPQEGMWIAPRDREGEVLRVIDDLRLGDHVTVVVGRAAAGTDVGQLANRLWDLPGLAQRYADFVKRFYPFRTRQAAASLSDREAFLIRTRAVAEFRRFPALDPSLPEEIVGDSWKRRKVVATFHELDEALRAASLRYFQRVNAAPRRPARGASRQQVDARGKGGSPA